MTRTTDAIQIKVSDSIRDMNTLKLDQVIEREAFKRGTRIWVRFASGLEHTYCAATTVVIHDAPVEYPKMYVADLV